MQEIQFVIDHILIAAFFALYGTVTWSLIRYSTRETYRYWAIGWVIYTIGAFLGILLPSEGLVPIDIFSLIGLYVGATLLLDGSRGRKLTRRRITLYLIGIVLIGCSLIICILLSLPFYFVFGLLGFHISYVCFLSAKTVYEIIEPVGQPKLWLIGGLCTWGLSWLIFPIVSIIPEFYGTFLIIQAVGVVVSGSSMLTLFMRTVTKDLERQSQITQIVSGLVQHDIRNYIQVAKLALDLTENRGIENDYWIDVASSSLDDARTFVNEMREITSTLTRSKPKPEPIQLLELIDSVKGRVVKEYLIQSNQIQVEISEGTVIYACRLTKEMLWNIFDNAFKHNSDTLIVREIHTSNEHVTLKIRDRGGGMTEDIKSFLNDPNSISDRIAPGLGLGIILIRGLSLMCDTQLHVADAIEESNVVGTEYKLRFGVSI